MGASALSSSGGIGGSKARGLGSLQSAPQQQAAPSAEPAQGFLIPYGGVDKYYPPPSPVKASHVSDLPLLLVQSLNAYTIPVLWHCLMQYYLECLTKLPTS